MYTAQTFENESEIRRLYVLHSLNHIIKYYTTIARVLSRNFGLGGKYM